MIIGFLCRDLNTLSLFKKIVQEYPLHGYIFYCDTSDTLKMGSEALENGIAFLTGKGSTVIVTENESIAEQVLSLNSKTSVLTMTTLNSFLDTLVEQGNQTTVRIVHLTEHSKETDKRISEILGGYFISD